LYVGKTEAVGVMEWKFPVKDVQPVLTLTDLHWTSGLRGGIDNSQDWFFWQIPAALDMLATSRGVRYCLRSAEAPLRTYQVCSWHFFCLPPPAFHLGYGTRRSAAATSV
jgi:hypothetical protein